MKNVIIILFALGLIGCGDEGGVFSEEVTEPNGYYDDYVRFVKLGYENQEGSYYNAYCLVGQETSDPFISIRCERSANNPHGSCNNDPCSGRFASIEQFAVCLELFHKESLDNCSNDAEEYWDYYGHPNTP